MSDLIQVQLPRDVVEKLRREHGRNVRVCRKDATATGNHAPDTKRNRAYIQRQLNEANESEYIATLCTDALASHPEVTDHAAD